MLIHGENLRIFSDAGITRVCALVLNMMRDRVERADVVACSDSLDELQQFEASERVEPYVDDGFSGFDGRPQKFRKNYRKGGPRQGWTHFER